jgi:hypothetical protein
VHVSLLRRVYLEQLGPTDGIDINTGWTNYFERLDEVVKRRRSAIL